MLQIYKLIWKVSADKKRSGSHIRVQQVRETRIARMCEKDERKCVCTCRALFRKQLFCPGSLLRPLLGAMEVMVLGVTSPCAPPTAPPPDAK